MATLGLVACSKQKRAVLQFEAYVGAGELRDLRFYLYDVEWLDKAGVPHSMRFDESATQSKSLALVDLRKAGHGAVEGQIDRGQYAGVRFTVGVPFESNHVNPLTAGSPLDRADLFWAWQSGYKFLRLDATQDGKEVSFHLGSTGCSSASALRPPAVPCAQPNRVRVEVRNFDPSKQPVIVNLTQLLNLIRGGTQHVCTGDYSSGECAAAYALTGLDPVSGACPEQVCNAQKLFIVGQQ